MLQNTALLLACLKGQQTTKYNSLGVKMSKKLAVAFDREENTLEKGGEGNIACYKKMLGFRSLLQD